MIYIDPPYGIKFGSNWQVSTRKRDVKDGKAEDVTRQPEQIQAFRDTWKLGIHSYLAYLRDRLVVARDLLTESGSVFVQIGDENVHLVRSVMDEVFGSDAFRFTDRLHKGSGWIGSGPPLERSPRLCDLVRQAAGGKQVPPALCRARESASAEGYTWVELPDGSRRRMTREERQGEQALPNGSRVFADIDLTKPGPGAKYTIRYQGQLYDSGNRWWKTPKESLEKVIEAGKTIAVGKKLRLVRYADDFPLQAISNLWDRIRRPDKDPVYVVQTNVEIVQRCLLMTTDPGDLVLDPTCGSGTTAYVAEQWGRRWITIDTSRVALALARTRLMAARFPYYLLADSPEGAEEGGGHHSASPPRTAPTAPTTSAAASSTSVCRTSPSRASPTTRTSRRG